MQSPDLHTLLQRRFGLTSFRSGQQDIIEAILAGKDTLVVMPTGSGKSLCYQAPALLLEGITLIISPLIALMKDQVDSLQQLQIPATYINSTLSFAEAQHRIEQVRRGRFKLLYIAPERFYSSRFLQLLDQIRVSLVAVDEAHCISQWGHDFRPSYLRIKEMIQRLKRPTVVALTATATREVREDILRQLGLERAEVFVTGFDRPNLKYFALELNETLKQEEMLRILPTIKGSGIVYVSTKRAVSELTHLLNSHQLPAIGYHGGMEKAQRDRAQNLWLEGKYPIVVATNAFGMGIDKPDVRFVLHYNMPGSLEAYYQEAGRAGRDGKTSYCILFYSFRDRRIQEFFIENNHPPPEDLKLLYEFLFSRGRKDIYLTYREIGAHCRMNEMAVGSAIKLFERHNILRRMSQKTSTFQIFFEDDPRVVEKKVARAPLQQKLIRWLINREGDEIPLEPTLRALGLSREQFSRAMHEMMQKQLIYYVPPFRGRGILLTSEKTDWANVPIDFQLYERHMRQQYQRLDEMESYVRQRICRRRYILNYFGEKYTANNCKACDVCLNWKSPLMEKARLLNSQE
ncbi:MAG: RecQ family ATP-dependent DNA helicase, partial [Calditrichaeota bacterium]